MSGQKQDGVDVIDMNGVEPLRGAQCKFKKSGSVLTPQEVEAEVEKAKGFDLGGIPLGDYTILTTSERNTATQAKIIELNQQHRKAGHFRIRLLDWEMVEEILREHPGLWDRLTAKSLRSLVQPIETGVSSLGVMVREGFEELRSPDSPAAIEQRLDAVRNLLDGYRWQEAELVLRGLRQNQWHVMSEPDRFLVTSFQAQVEYAKGKFVDAGRLFIEAGQYLPDDCRAKFNRAVGLELLEEREEACGLARRLTQEYPDAAKPWAVVCRTEPETVPVADLEAELPAVAKANDEVQVALGLRALRQEDWSSAERFGKAAARQDRDWAAPILIRGQAKLQLAIRHAYRPCFGPAILVEEGALNEPIRLLDEAVAIADRTGNAYLLIQALTGRARAKSLLGDEAGMEQDVNRAFQHRPQDPTVLTYYAQWLSTHDQPTAAVSLLRKAVSLGGDADTEFLLAVALCSQSEDASDLEWIGHAEQAAKNPSCASRTHAIELAVDGLTANGEYERAESLLNELAGEGLAKSVVEAGRARVAVTRGNKAAAVEHAVAASLACRETTPRPDRRFVAETLVKVGEYERALIEWQAVTKATRQITDAWALVDVAKRIDKPGVVLEIAREWRHAGVRDRRLIDEEITLLDQYKPREAVRLIQDELQTRPDDPYLVLRLSLLGLKLNQPELVCGDVDRLPSPAEIDPRNGPAIIQVLLFSDGVEDAVRYSYRLLRHHPRDPNAHSLFAMLMLAQDKDIPEVFKEGPVSIAPGVAFGFIEEDEENEKWWVVEDEDSGAGFDDELPPCHPLVVAVLGKQPGDSFLIPGMSGLGRRASIRGLATKYVHRLRRTMDEWETRFTGQLGFEKLHIAGAGEEGVVPDFTPILHRMHNRRRQVEELLATYRENPYPLHALAEGLGVPIFEAIASLAFRDDCSIRCCSGDRSEFLQTMSFARTATAWVVDCSSIATLDLLQLESLLGQWPGELLVSTSTMTQLEDCRRTIRFSRGDGQVTTTNRGVGLQFIENDPEIIERRIQRVDSLIALLQENASVKDVGELATLPNEARESLVTLLGRHGAESVVLAARPGHILWSDDGVVSLIAHQFLPGLRRVWTQAVLADATGRGLIADNEYRIAAAKLMGFGYVATHFNAGVILSGCEVAEWNPQAWPLKQALDALTEKNETDAKWRIAVGLFRELFLPRIAHTGHETVAAAVLDRLADGPEGVGKVEQLRRLLPTLFGLHVTAERAAADLITSWMQIRRADI